MHVLKFEVIWGDKTSKKHFNMHGVIPHFGRMYVTKQQRIEKFLQDPRALTHKLQVMNIKTEEIIQIRLRSAQKYKNATYGGFLQMCKYTNFEHTSTTTKDISKKNANDFFTDITFKKEKLNHRVKRSELVHKTSEESMHLDNVLED